MEVNCIFGWGGFVVLRVLLGWFQGSRFLIIVGLGQFVVMVLVIFEK